MKRPREDTFVWQLWKTCYVAKAEVWQTAKKDEVSCVAKLKLQVLFKRGRKRLVKEWLFVYSCYNASDDMHELPKPSQMNFLRP